MKVGNTDLENVTEFEYLSSLLSWDNDCAKEIRKRIAKALGAMAGIKNEWTCEEISLKTKLSILRKLDSDKLMAFEMRCYRQILHIRWQQMIRNEEVRRRVKCKPNVLQMVMKRKLNSHGHVYRMNNSRLIKRVIFDMVDGTGTEEIQQRMAGLYQVVVSDDVHSANILPQSRIKWRQFVKRMVDTNGHIDGWIDGNLTPSADKRHSPLNYNSMLQA